MASLLYDSSLPSFQSLGISKRWIVDSPSAVMPLYYAERLAATGSVVLVVGAAAAGLGGAGVSEGLEGSRYILRPYENQMETSIH